MKKVLKVLFIIAVVLLLTGLCGYGFITYRTHQFTERAIAYIDEKYGIETTFAAVEYPYYDPFMEAAMAKIRQEQDAGILPFAGWQTDIVVSTVDEPTVDIRVRFDFNGKVSADDYYYYILEDKLKDEFSGKSREIWGNKSELSVHIPYMYEYFIFLGGKRSYPTNDDLGKDIVEVMDREKENVSIQEIKEIMPEYDLTININSDEAQVDRDKECNNIYDMVKYLKENDFYPKLIAVNYNYQENTIKRVILDDSEKITSPEKVMGVFDKEELSY